jgi:hypothetical protein
LFVKHGAALESAKRLYQGKRDSLTSNVIWTRWNEIRMYHGLHALLTEHSLWECVLCRSYVQYTYSGYLAMATFDCVIEENKLIRSSWSSCN